MTVSEALEEIQSPEFYGRLSVVDDLDSFLFRLARQHCVRELEEVVETYSGWHRVRSRLQVLVAVPTPRGEGCEEDVAVAALLWILRCEKIDDLLLRIYRGPIWNWSRQVVDYFCDGGEHA